MARSRREINPLPAKHKHDKRRKEQGGRNKKKGKSKNTKK
jgi:hypothetical protein